MLNYQYNILTVNEIYTSYYFHIIIFEQNNLQITRRHLALQKSCLFQVIFLYFKKLFSLSRKK